VDLDTLGEPTAYPDGFAVCDGAALSVEVVSLDIDELGTPCIDDADPNTAGKIWIK
jgi:hypothetical protein